MALNKYKKEQSQKVLVPFKLISGKETIPHVINFDMPGHGYELIPMMPLLGVACEPHEFVKVSVKSISTNAINKKSFGRSLDDEELNANLVNQVFEYVCFDVSVVDKEEPLEENANYFTYSVNTLKIRG